MPMLRRLGTFIWWLISFFWGFVCVAVLFLVWATVRLLGGSVDDAMTCMSAAFFVLAVATFRQGWPSS